MSSKKASSHFCLKRLKSILSSFDLLIILSSISVIFMHNFKNNKMYKYKIKRKMFYFYVVFEIISHNFLNGIKSYISPGMSKMAVIIDSWSAHIPSNFFSFMRNELLKRLGQRVLHVKSRYIR